MVYHLKTLLNQNGIDLIAMYAVASSSDLLTVVSFAGVDGPFLLVVEFKTATTAKTQIEATERFGSRPSKLV